VITAGLETLLSIHSGEGRYFVEELLKFKELEEKVKGLVEEYTLLHSKKTELENLIKLKDGELEEAESKIRKLNEERESVRHKVDSLLGMLEDINTQEL
jgi:chromosome segregation ATPase